MDNVINFPNLFTTEQIDYIGQRVVEAASQACGNKLRDVILYGSYARGDYTEWSDVDIMVLADVEESERWKYDNILIEILEDLNHHMNLLLSVLVIPYKSFEQMKNINPYYQSVSKEGKRLCSISIA